MNPAFCHYFSRARKIRCDSTRPICNNCVRRSNPCEYDAVPKRRGPDKRPGTRQRSCKKRPSEGPSASPPSKRKRSALVDEESQSTPKAKDSKKRRLSPSPSAVVVKEESYASLSSHEPALSRVTELPSPRNPNPPGLVFKVFIFFTRVTYFLTPAFILESERSTLRPPQSPLPKDSYYKPPPHRAEGNISQTDTQGSLTPDPTFPILDFRTSGWWDELLRTYS